MKKYRLKKDLPVLKAGAECYIDSWGGLVSCDNGDKRRHLIYSLTELVDFPNILTDWFEEIPEKPKTVLDLEDGDECWAIFHNSDSEGGAVAKQVHWHEGEWQASRALGEISLTKEECEKEIAWRKAREILKRDTKGFKPNWHTRNEDRFCVCFSLSCGERSKGCLGHLIVANTQYNITRELYFATQADAEESIRKHEKEWKTYLGVGE